MYPVPFYKSFLKFQLGFECDPSHENLSPRNRQFSRARTHTHTDLSFVNFTRPRQFLHVWSSQTENETKQKSCIVILSNDCCFLPAVLTSDWYLWKLWSFLLLQLCNRVQLDKGKDREGQVCGLDTGKNTGNLLPLWQGTKEEGCNLPRREIKLWKNVARGLIIIIPITCGGETGGASWWNEGGRNEVSTSIRRIFFYLSF